MRLLTAKQTAELLQISTARVYELARSSLLPCVRLGRQVRFEEGALREFLARGGTAKKQHS
jgi:excisionase family DNA binding protein